MPKLKLGQTPEQIRAEEAEKQRQVEIEIQQASLERQARVEALHKKQKSTKVAVIAGVSALAIVFTVFGTYNTFFKKELTVEDIQPQINAAVNSLNFPSEGLDNYIKENCSSLFYKYMATDVNDDTIKSIEVDENSCYISRVSKLSSTIAQVYFSVDVTVTKNDTEVTDPEVIKTLLKNENISAQVTPTESATENPTEAPTEATSENKTTETAKAEKTTEASTTGATNPTGVANAEDGYDVAAITEVPSYYISETGKIMQYGTTSKVRYNFYVPIEFYFIYSDITEDGTPTGSVVGGGFRPAGDMTLYTLLQPDVTEFEEIAYNQALVCHEDYMVDEETLRQMQVSVDKILDDLYSGRDTSQEFFNYRKFNGFDSVYNGIVAMESYTEPNALGMNTHVTYSIKTSQGFIYTLETWLLVEKDGSSYIITKML